ncbi:MAG TPA: Rieske (2Fe-2S) protein [Bryobacteraceae bacterium]|jgi:Rieske Fe-S protein|nr:Rieske (2Fe-2S) protein [Bryobacteraceae bacterium]
MPAKQEPPLWREEFSVFQNDERYVSRRQLTKFLTLTSLAMFAGNIWILLRSLVKRAAGEAPAVTVARLGEMPVGGVKLFDYPRQGEQCVLVRIGEDAYAAYSQKCTHLSCAVYYSPESRDLVCPCHEGHFSIQDGSVLQGPPTRPLPAVKLERRGEHLVAVGMTTAEGD